MRFRIYGTQLHLGAELLPYNATLALDEVQGTGGTGELMGDPQFTKDGAMLGATSSFEFSDPLTTGVGFTVSAMVRFPAVSATFSPLIIANNLNIGFTDRIRVKVGTDDRDTGAYFPVGVWQHLLVEYRVSSVRIYLNGIFRGQTNTPVANTGGLLLLSPAAPVEVSFVTAYQRMMTPQTVLHIEREVTHRASLLNLRRT